MLFIHLSADENLGCFHFLATMNNDAMTIHVEVLVWKYIFSSLGYIPRSEIVDYMAVSYTHLTLPTIVEWCRSRWSPYH